jgi:hypothetical protein
MFARGAAKDDRYRESQWNKKWALTFLLTLAKNFRANGSAFGSANAMVARSLIHDGMSTKSWCHWHLGIIRQKVHCIRVCYSYEYVQEFKNWLARARLPRRAAAGLCLFVFSHHGAIAQHLKSLSFTTYRLKCNIKSWWALLAKIAVWEFEKRVRMIDWRKILVLCTYVSWHKNPSLLTF